MKRCGWVGIFECDLNVCMCVTEYVSVYVYISMCVNICASIRV